MSKHCNGFQARTGCELDRLPLGNASVLVEYEIVDGDAQVLQALINGMWIDPQDFLAESIFDSWQEELTRQHRDSYMVAA